VELTLDVTLEVDVTLEAAEAAEAPFEELELLLEERAFTLLLLGMALPLICMGIAETETVIKARIAKKRILDGDDSSGKVDELFGLPEAILRTAKGDGLMKVGQRKSERGLEEECHFPRT